MSTSKTITFDGKYKFYSDDIDGLRNSRLLKGAVSKRSHDKNLTQQKAIKNEEYTVMSRKAKRISNLAPVSGRQHAEIQTSLYLEQLSTLTEEEDIECQTDPFLSRPQTPMFVRQKVGVDQFTEILPRDLFDFDIEVGPVLEVLIGKTIEQALVEVLEEEELAHIRQKIAEFSEIRNADLLEEQRLEESQRRARMEKERRREEHVEAEKQRQELAEKISAKSFTNAYMREIVPLAYESLQQAGYFYDPVEKDILENFMPWLIDAVTQELDLEMRARDILDQLIRDVATERFTIYGKLDNEEGMQTNFRKKEMEQPLFGAENEDEGR